MQAQGTPAEIIGIFESMVNLVKREKLKAKKAGLDLGYAKGHADGYDEGLKDGEVNGIALVCRAIAKEEA